MVGISLQTLHPLLICKCGPCSLWTKRVFHHFQTVVIAPIVSPLSLNRRKGKFTIPIWEFCHMQIRLMISLKLKSHILPKLFQDFTVSQPLIMLVMKWQYVYVNFLNETLLKTSVRKVIRDIKGYK